jgi:hypothetical protein
LKGKCIFQKTLYIFRVVEIEVEHGDQHIMGFGLILGWKNEKNGVKMLMTFVMILNLNYCNFESKLP